MSERSRKIVVSLLVFLSFSVTLCVSAFMLMVCWNFSIATYFSLPDITFLQSLAINIFARIILDNPIRFDVTSE